jgi:hypothetical protein
LFSRTLVVAVVDVVKGNKFGAKTCLFMPVTVIAITNFNFGTNPI